MAEPRVKPRIGVRKNPDGTESSHLMIREYIPGKGWVVFPSLFQDPDGTWVDLNAQYGRNWMPIYEEAVRRGEVYEFGEDLNAAVDFADNGSWKSQLNTNNIAVDGNTEKGVAKTQSQVTKEVAQYADPRDYLQGFLEAYAVTIIEDATQEEKLEAELKLKEIEGLVGKDNYALMVKTAPSYMEQQGLVTGRPITELKKDQISTEIKKIVPAIIVDAMKGVGAIAQVYSGLQNLSDITMPTPPELPQPSGELSEAMRIAQRESQQVDPRVQEARKRAALQTLMQGREAAITGSTGQAGSFAANMQQNLINVNAELQKGVIADEALRQQAQGQYNQLVGQQLRENQFRKQYEMGIFDRNYQEAVARRAGQEGLVATGLSNLSNLASGMATNIALANYYRDLRSQLDQPTTTGQEQTFMKGLRDRQAAQQAMGSLYPVAPATQDIIQRGQTLNLPTSTLPTSFGITQQPTPSLATFGMTPQMPPFR